MHRLLVGLAGPEMGLVVGLLDGAAVLVGGGVRDPVASGPRPRRRLCPARGVGGDRNPRGRARGRGARVLQGLDGGRGHEERRLDVVVEVADGRSELGQKRSQARRRGAGDGRVGDQHGGVGAGGEDGLVVGESLHQVAQLDPGRPTARGNASSCRRTAASTRRQVEPAWPDETAGTRRAIAAGHLVDLGVVLGAGSGHGAVGPDRQSRQVISARSKCWPMRKKASASSRRMVPCMTPLIRWIVDVLDHTLEPTAPRRGRPVGSRRGSARSTARCRAPRPRAARRAGPAAGCPGRLRSTRGSTRDCPGRSAR